MTKATGSNNTEEVVSEDTESIKPLDFEDGANLSPLHVAAIMGNKAKMVALLKDYKDDIDKGDKIGRTPLIFSILGDRFDCAEALLKAGADVNKTDVDERTALHWAAYQGNYSFVKLLLDKGAKQGCQDKEGRTPLHLSLSHDNLKVTSKLLKDADIDCRDENGLVFYVLMTPLHFSVAYERNEHTKMLLHAKASPDCQDNDKKTVLHWAKTNKEMAIVQRLLDYERVMLILNTKDSDGRTALHLAVAADNKRLVRLLTSLDDCSVSELDHMHRTPLHWASILGHTALVEILLDRGADPLIPDKNGVRPLHYAAQNNFGKTVNAMLQHEHVKDVPDNDKRTALMWAAAKGAYDALSVLISHKQDILAADKAGATALHMAAEGGHLQCVSLLLQHQAGVNALDKQQYTPLFCACQMGHKEVVESLLLHGAAVDLEDKEGRTPLHWASVGGRTDICGMLLDHGLSSSKKDKLGRPALHYAAYSGFYTCMALLLEFGADVDALDNTGVTALHWACASGSLDAVKLLFRYNAFPNFVELEGDKLTPLDYAIIREHQDVAQFMFEHSAFTINGIQDVAATVIQAAWRGYSFRRTFQAKKQLLILHEKKRKQKQDVAESEDFASTCMGDEDFSSQVMDRGESSTNVSSKENSDYFAIEPEFQEELEKQLSERLATTNHANATQGQQMQSNKRDYNEDKFIDYFVKSMGLSNSAANIENGKVLRSLSKEEVDLSSDERRVSGMSDVGQYQEKDHVKVKLASEPNKGISDNSVISSLHDNSEFSDSLTSDRLLTDQVEVMKGPSETPQRTDHCKDKTVIGNRNFENETLEDKSFRDENSELDKAVRTDIVDKQTAESINSDKGMRTKNRTSSKLKYAKDKKVDKTKNNISDRTKSRISETDGVSADSLLQPWQIYKRERNRAKIIRQKIDSAVIIQRAVRKYLAKIRPRGSVVEVVESSDEKEKEDPYLAEIAALIIQLNWRKYLKNKLMKEKLKASAKKEAEDQRIFAAREKKPKVILHRRTSNDSPKSKPENTEVASLRVSPKGGDNLDSIRNHQAHKRSSISKNREGFSQTRRKSRPKTGGVPKFNEGKAMSRSSTQILPSRYKASSPRVSSDATSTHMSGLKVYMPQSWSSNLQKFPMRY